MIGNGISFIILIGIIARLPQSLFQEFVSRLASPGAGGIIMFLLEIVFFVVRYCSSNFAGSRRPQSSRTVCETYCRKQTIWWCKTIYSFKGECCECNAYHLCPGNHVYPYYIGRFLKCWQQQVVLYAAFVDHTSFWYNFVFAILIIVFTYFYTAITINPNQMAEDMKRNNGFIPGVKPGKNTN